MPYAGAVPAGKYVVVCYLSDDGNVTYDAGTRQISFDNNHFSNYAVFVSQKPAVIVTDGNGSGLYAMGKTVTITAEPQRAAKGDTVTLTVKPDQGYKLDILTVTDRNGKEIPVTEKNGKYTFTMPASRVTVKATFIKNQQPGETVFTDIPADAYYAEAVQWVVANGITAGTSATTFSPDAACTRGQIMTFLFRAMGK